MDKETCSNCDRLSREAATLNFEIADKVKEIADLTNLAEKQATDKEAALDEVWAHEDRLQARLSTVVAQCEGYIKRVNKLEAALKNVRDNVHVHFCGADILHSGLCLMAREALGEKE